MRVVEPHQFKTVKRPKHTKGRRKIISRAVLILILLGGGVFLVKTNPFSSNNDAQNGSQSGSQNGQQVAAEAPIVKTGAFKQFSGEEFKALYQAVAYPNIQQISEDLSITGNTVADLRIKQLAEERGYKPTAIPQNAIVKVEEPRLEDDNLLQPLAAESWKSLKAAAIKEDYPLTVISAYRSPEYQRNLFLERLAANGTTPRFIADGIGDAAIARTLEMTAVPGYSRHHTGYTVDFWCEDGSNSFVTSSCYRWIRADNYLHAKEHGWIPSYPEDTDLQGPEPEPWEYVWVGTNLLRE